MKNISALWGIEPKTFYILAATLTFAVLGTTQALKGKLGKLSARWICFILSVICAVMQAEIINSVITSVFDLFMFVFALATLVYQISDFIKNAATGNEAKIREAVAKELERLPQIAVDAIKKQAT